MFVTPGLGDFVDDSSSSLPLLGNSVLISLALGIGIIIAAKTFSQPEPKGRRGPERGEREEYVSYVAKKHKLSKADQAWLMEHGE